MRLKTYVIWRAIILLCVGMLSACGAPQRPDALALTNMPASTPELKNPTPIISTAISESLQALPTPTDTLKVAEAAGQIITMSDNGKTLTLQPGQRFGLMLDDRYVWEISIANQEIVSQAEGATPVGGSQGVYEAHQAGQTQLTASGDPLCRSQRPACMMPTVIFTLNILVREKS
jgi:hypothetical protein